MKFLVIFIFVVFVLVQFCVILIRNGMFYINKIFKFGYKCLLCNGFCVYLPMKKNENNLTYFGDPLCKM